MSEPIKLTDEERIAAVASLLKRQPSPCPSAPHGVSTETLVAMVDTVMDAINQQRLGDPVGTIRNSRVRNEMYERVEGLTGQRYWRAYEADGKTYDDLNWATDVIYTPTTDQSKVHQ
jgi:hypothetical protein